MPPSFKPSPPAPSVNTLTPVTRRALKWISLTVGTAFLLGAAVGMFAARTQAAQGKKSPQHKKAKTTAPVRAAVEKVIWEAWYKVLTSDGTPVQYYRDRVALADSKLHFSNQVWKREEGFINEEQLGAFSNSTADLSPLFFNFRSTYRASETVIDGTIQPDHTIAIKITKAGVDQPLIRRNLPTGTIFSSFFPVWVREKNKSLKLGENASFYALQEDDIDNGFSVNSGRVRRDADDDFAKKTRTTKLMVEYRSIPSTWWVDKDGIAQKILMTQQGITVERTTEAEAKKIFETANQKAPGP